MGWVESERGGQSERERRGGWRGHEGRGWGVVETTKISSSKEGDDQDPRERCGLSERERERIDCGIPGEDHDLEDPCALETEPRVRNQDRPAPTKETGRENQDSEDSVCHRRRKRISILRIP